MLLAASFMSLLLATLTPFAVISVFAAGTSRAASHRVAATLARPDIFRPPAANTTPVGNHSGPDFDKSGAGATEVVSMRTRTSKTLITRGGYQLIAYPSSIHFQDSSGKWQEIDNTLIRTNTAGYSYQNRANAYTVYFPADIGRAPIDFALGNASVAFGLQGAQGSVVVNGNTATYSVALSGVSVAYEALNDQVKETLTLTDAQQSSFTYSLRISPGLFARRAAFGAIDFVDRSGQTRFGFAPPFMVDAAGSRSSAVQVALFGAGSSQTLVVTADTAWLNDKTRRFPVVIDPTVTLSYSGSSIVKTYSGANQDCYLVSSSPTTSYCGGRSLYVGYTGSAIERSLLQFNVSIPQDANVLEADLALNLSAAKSSSATSVSLYSVTSSWTTSATWNTRDGTNPWTTAGGDYSTPATWTNGSVGPSTGWYHWYLAPVVQGWVNGSSVNTGLLLKADNETATNQLTFYSSETGNTANWPYLKVIYQLGIGDLPWYRNVVQPLSDRFQLKENLSSGNLLGVLQLVNIRGTGLNEVFDLNYNILSPNLWDFGRAWITNTGWDLYVDPNMGDGASFFGPTGYAFHYIKNPDGSYTTPPGIDADLVHNGDGTWTVIYHYAGEKFNFTSNGLYLTSDVDRNGNTISFAYDANGALASITDTQGRVTSFTYTTGLFQHCAPPTKSGFVGTITDPSGRKYSFTYDSNCDLTTYTDPNNKVTTFTYDSLFNLIQITDPLGNQTKLTYNSIYKVTSVTRVTNVSQGTGPTTSLTYTTGNTVVTDPNNNQSTYVYDARDRVTQTTDASGNTYTAYTNDNKHATDKDQNGNQTTYSYDTKNNPTKQQLASGASSSTSYTDTSHPYEATIRTDFEANSSNFTFDTNGNLYTSTDPAGKTTTLNHNSNGTVSSYVDANGATTTFSYDSHGNLVKISYPAPLGAYSYSYDSLSRVTGVTDGKSQTTHYAYDLFDRVSQITYADNSTITYTYDADGNRLSRVDSTGTTSFGYDSLNRLISESLPGSRSISYGYDAVSNLTSRTDSGGTEQRAYNSLNELASITDPNQKVTTFQYDSTGRNTQIAYPNGVTETLTYNSSGQPISIAANGPGSSHMTSFTYSFVNPANGQTTSKRYSMSDLAGNTTSYQYDSLDRLTTATKKSSSGTTLATYQYTYDNLGNILSKTINGAVTSFTYNAASEISQEGSTTFTYDANGNETGNSTGLAIAYNAADQSTSITPPGQQAIQMNYADAGQVQRVSAGSTTYQYDLSGLSLLNDSSGSTYFSRFTNGVPLSMRKGTSTYYYLHDSLGSVVGLTDSSGNVANSYAYDPFGNLVTQSETIANPLKWLGAVFDTSTGLYKLGARYYSPDQGRFTQSDPLHYTVNRYGYGGDDPINNSDTNGAVWTSWQWWGLLVDLNYWETQWLVYFAISLGDFWGLVTVIGFIFGCELACVVTFLIALGFYYDGGVLNWLNHINYNGVWIALPWYILNNWGGTAWAGCNGCSWGVPIWVP